MKARALQGFLEELVGGLGGEAHRRGDHSLTLHLPEKAEAFVGRSEVVFAFNLRGLQEDPRSELGTVGNPVFDRILDLARQNGRVGERYRRAGRVPLRLPDPAEHFRFEGGPIAFGAPQATYTPLYFFLFRAEYSLEELADELEVVPLDGVSLQTLGQTPELIDYWEKLDPAPVEGRRAVSAFPVPECVLGAAIRLLERRLRKRLGRMRRDSEEHLARERENIETYYRQLIEESRNAGRRWAVSAAQREERVRLLQLDWKRRVEESYQHWRPRIDVRLISVAAAHLPRIGWEVSPPKGSKRTGVTGKRKGEGARGTAERPRVYWDEADRTFVPPACEGCGGPAAVWERTAKGLRCPACSR